LYFLRLLRLGETEWSESQGDQPNAKDSFSPILLFVYCRSLPDVQSLFLGLKVENKDCTTVATVLSRNTVWRIF
jgi:hypothetical protein